MLSGDCTVVQASGLDGLSFDPFSLQEDGLGDVPLFVENRSAGALSF
jgi:hypothetical protein